jgi:hypothetical protein
MTPYEKLKSLPHAGQFLKPRICFEQLDTLAASISDNDAAEHLMCQGTTTPMKVSFVGRVKIVMSAIGYSDVLILAVRVALFDVGLRRSWLATKVFP